MAIAKIIYVKKQMKSVYVEKLLRYLRIYKLYLKKRDLTCVKYKNLIEKISEDYKKIQYNKDILLILLHISVICNIYIFLIHIFFLYENGLYTNKINNGNETLIFYNDFYKSHNTCNINYIE